MPDDDDRFMDLALELAQAGWGRVHPNPLVGAVVVRDGRIVGEGWHAEFGGPHAEVTALRMAGQAAAGSTLYVTLEPCAHHGKTPPCTDAIRAAGIARVVYAAPDPNAEAAGGGQVLASTGIEVVGGVRKAEALAIDPAFHWIHRNDRPWLALKLAMSMDGRLGATAGRTTAVTGAEALAETHRLRAGFDAILVGRRTIEADDPLLTVRGGIRPRVPPVRVVFDSGARTPPTGRLLRTVDEAPVWVVTAPDAPESRVTSLREAGARILEARSDDAGLDVTDAVDVLWREGARSVLCEGGGRLAASLLGADLVRRMYLFIAPVFYAGDGPPAFPLGGRPAGRWQLRETRRVGRDAILVLDRVEGED